MHVGSVVEICQGTGTSPTSVLSRWAGNLDAYAGKFAEQGKPEGSQTGRPMKPGKNHAPGRKLWQGKKSTYHLKKIKAQDQETREKKFLWIFFVSITANALEIVRANGGRNTTQEHNPGQIKKENHCG